jgi:fatty acid desaturase
MPHGRQGYVTARLSEHEGRVLWKAMFRDVGARCLATPALGRALVKLGALLVLLACALWLGWFATSWPERALAAVFLALLLAQFAFMAHDAGHGALSASPAANRALGQLAMTAIAGLAFDEWIERHHAHHRFCQDESRDPDMAVSFVASLTVESRRDKSALGNFMTRHQATHIWALTLLFGHSQRHLSQAAVLRNPRRYRLDAMLLLVHGGLWLGVPCLLLGVPLSAALLVYVVPATLLGPYLAAIFWVNHIGMPLVRDREPFSFAERQVVTSRTITSPPACDWLFGGLNYQIEHHLFPQVPSCRLPELQAIVRAHLARHQVAYNGVTWREAVRLVAAHLRHVARAA